MLNSLISRNFYRRGWPHHAVRGFAIQPFKIPDIGEGITEVQLMEWFVKPGQQVDEMDKLCLVESDKAAVEITSRFKGTVVKLLFNPLEKVKIGSVIVEIDDGKPESVKEEATVKPVAVPVQATPAIRALAKERGIDLSLVHGTGPGGRITKEDVEAFSNPTGAKTANSELIKLSGVPLAMAKSMAASSVVPHLSLTEQIDADELLRVIKELKVVAGERFNLPTVTITAVLVKALSLSLADFPALNSKFKQVGEELYVERYLSHNIGVAMDTPKGLVVPNIKGVENLSIVDIQRELFALHEKGLAGKLTLEDLKGGTVSLSNIGVIGGVEAKSLLFDGQALIGAVGRLRTVPGFEDAEIVKERVMNVTWSADHRAVDGATVARFSNRFKELLENPERMMIDLS